MKITPKHSNRTHNQPTYKPLYETASFSHFFIVVYFYFLSALRALIFIFKCNIFISRFQKTLIIKLPKAGIYFMPVRIFYPYFNPFHTARMLAVVDI